MSSQTAGGGQGLPEVVVKRWHGGYKPGIVAKTTPRTQIANLP
ncbi:MAG TPA: hypothetical protein VIK47_01520 [Kiloniellales bacterium]